MNTFALLFLLSSTSASALRLPVFQPGPDTFSIPVTLNEAYQPDGPTSLRRAYAKHGMVTEQGKRLRIKARGLRHSPGGRKKSNKRQWGKDTEDMGKIPSGLEYSSQIMIGEQKMNVVFDTCSGESWVLSTKMSASKETSESQENTFFDPSKSKTFKSEPNTPRWKVQYVDGSSVSGSLGADNILLDRNTSIAGQSISLVSNSTKLFSEEQADGTIGLGFNPPSKPPTFLDNLTSQHQPPSKLFTVDMRHDTSGSVDFGYVDHSKHIGEIHYVPVDRSKGDWRIETSKGYKVGEAMYNYQSTASSGAVIDTASKFVLLPSDAAGTYWSGVSGAAYDSQSGGFTYPCNATDDLPSVSLDVGGVFAELPGYLMNAGAIDDDEKTCFGALQSLTDPTRPAVYGDTFLKGTFAVFDYGAARLGCAPKAPNYHKD